MRVKSGGVVQNIPLDDDLCWIKPDLAPKSSDIYTEVSENFFKYNEFEGIFAGYIVLKAGSYLREQEILKLPKGAEYGFSFITAVDSNKQPVRLQLSSEGSLQFEASYQCQSQTSLSVVGNVPIKFGGGGVLTSFIKALRTFFQKENVKEVTYA